MPIAMTLKELVLRWSLTLASTISFLGWAVPMVGEERSETPNLLNGVVVEEVGEGSGLEKAGLRRGDVLLSWERLPSPPANPEGALGTIESVYDWNWLKIEQAPRGTVLLKGQRSTEVKYFEVVSGGLTARIRARMPKDILKYYEKGKEMIEAGELEAGVAFWERAAEVAQNQSWGQSLSSWLHFRAGDLLKKARHWGKAHGAYRAALEATQEPLAQSEIWQAIGDAYSETNQFVLAQESYGSAQEIRKKIWGESLILALGFHHLGRLEWKQRKFDSAEDYWQRVLEIRQKLAPGGLHVASSLNNLGLLAWKRYDLERAAEYFTASLLISQRLAPGGHGEAQSLNNLGLLASGRSDFDQAAEYFERALEIKQGIVPKSLSVAKSLHNLGLLEYRRGDIAEAARYYQRALEIKQDLAPHSLSVAASLSNLGMLSFDRGDLNRAAEYYEKALHIQKDLVPGSLDMAANLNNMGLLAFGRGDLDRAMEYFEGALEIKQQLAPNRLEMARGLNNLGMLTYSRGELDQAAEYYKRSLEIKEALAPNSRHVVASFTNLGALALDRGDLGRAAEYYEKALEISQVLASGGLDVATSMHNLGFLALDRGDLVRAAEWHERALEIQNKLAPNSAMEAEMYYALGAVLREQGQPKPALTLFLQALQALDNQVTKLGGSQDVKADFLAGRAGYYRGAIGLLLELKRPEEGFCILERFRARSFLEQLAERDLVFSDIPLELEQQRRQIVRRYDETQHEIGHLSPTEGAGQVEIRLTELKKLRWEYEDLTERIIEASPDLGALRYPKPLDVGAARRILDPGSVMLSYSVSEDQIHLFILTRNEDLQVETLQVSQKELRADVERILGLQRRSEDPYEKPLRQVGERLYQALIRPAEEQIVMSERILIVPDGPLHLLPFALLVRKTDLGGPNQDFQYLVEWKPLHFVRSATVYAELKRQRRNQNDEASEVLALAAFGDPHYQIDRSRSDLIADRNVDVYVRSAVDRGLEYSPLPNSRDEVTRIGALYPEGSVRTFLGAEASEEQVKSLSENVGIVHFATHGYFDDRFPLNSALALTIPEEFRKGEDNGLLQAWEIYEDVRINADLVVLSACETGIGEEVDGEGLRGLTRAFHFAGARTVASSLWRVDDRATTELMVRFYRHLRAGLPKDEALRAAQLELIRGPIEMTNRLGQVVERDLSLPYYWAAFRIVGDWK